MNSPLTQEERRSLLRTALEELKRNKTSVSYEQFSVPLAKVETDVLNRAVEEGEEALKATSLFSALSSVNKRTLLQKFENDRDIFLRMPSYGGRNWMIYSERAKELIGYTIRAFYAKFPFVEKRKITLAPRQSKIVITTRVALPEGTSIDQVPEATLLQALLTRYNSTARFFHVSSDIVHLSTGRTIAINVVCGASETFAGLRNFAQYRETELINPHLASFALNALPSRGLMRTPNRSLGTIPFNKTYAEELDGLFKLFGDMVEVMPCTKIA